MNDNSKIFLDYLMSFGFNPDNYENILELFSSAPSSMSRFLYPNQFLLSGRVYYEELDNLGLNGALGYLNFDGIRIPMNYYSNDRFGNNYPSIEVKDFGAIIGNGIDTDLVNAFNFDNDKYLGICLDEGNENIDIISAIYQNVVSYINSNSDNRYRLARDYDSIHNKELLLITEAPIKVLSLELTPSKIKVR